MVTEGNEQEPWATPVSSDALIVGRVYFSLNYVDANMVTPVLDPWVFLGIDLSPGDHGRVYFQDADSYAQGVRIESAKDSEATLYVGSSGEVNHIFEFPNAVDELRRCAARRKKHNLDM